MTVDYSKIQEYLGADAEALLNYSSPKISKDSLHLPGSDFVDRIWMPSDRNINVLRSLQTLFGNGRLKDTGYLSILPVDQGIEHSAGASFAPNPVYFDPENIVKLAIEGGCNAVASTYGVLGTVARKYAHKIPFIVKINHNELLTYPNKFDQVMFGTIDQARNMGAVAVGATIYFGSDESTRQIIEVSEAFAYAHELGMATILWCYLRNNKFKGKEGDMHTAADLTGQANHLGVTIQADIIKQKLPERNGGYNMLNVESSYGKTNQKIYTRPFIRQSDRSRAVSGSKLLYGTRRADQFGRRIEGRKRHRRRDPHSRHQQTRRRYGTDLRTKSVPASDGRRRRTSECDPGCLS
jgi:class I fructose-bisphosphate aldolase